MAKKIDLNRTVYELTQEYPELIQIMAKLGFTEITKKPMLMSAGKIMTIPKGAKLKNIPMTDVVTALLSNGFELTGEMPAIQIPDNKPVPMPHAKVQEDPESRERLEQLKGYLRRLADGEDLESVRADFVEKFQAVDAAEIMKAEQALMQEGMPVTEVQKLCDIHSALFHGATKQEQIENAEKAVQQSLLMQRLKRKDKAESSASAHENVNPAAGLHADRTANPAAGLHADKTANPAANPYIDKNAKAAALEAEQGHPLQTLTRENNALTALLDEYKETKDLSLVSKIRDLSVHYAKKGDLLYPLLKVKYDISGPSNVMWSVDDEIRDELGDLFKSADRDDAWFERLDAVLTRAGEMIYKEQNILFPICAVYFSEEEWKEIYRDAKDYAVCFGVTGEVWSEAEKAGSSVSASSGSGEIVLPGGHMTPDQLRALLNTIPLEISFVDADNINRFFNEGPKVFKRPGMAIDREVFSCHPPKIEPMVRRIIEDFREGRRDSVPVWMEKGGKTMLVTYMAVRDADGNYVGTAEFVQDMEFAKEHFQKAE